MRRKYLPCYSICERIQFKIPRVRIFINVNINIWNNVNSFGHAGSKAACVHDHPRGICRICINSHCNFLYSQLRNPRLWTTSLNIISLLLPTERHRGAMIRWMILTIMITGTSNTTHIIIIQLLCYAQKMFFKNYILLPTIWYNGCYGGWGNEGNQGVCKDSDWLKIWNMEIRRYDKDLDA